MRVDPETHTEEEIKDAIMGVDQSISDYINQGLQNWNPENFIMAFVVKAGELLGELDGIGQTEIVDKMTTLFITVKERKRVQIRAAKNGTAAAETWPANSSEAAAATKQAGRSEPAAGKAQGRDSEGPAEAFDA